ncbi:ABC transporter ATP-binding protein [Spirosoma montaniterrae]|uniref:ABC transporter ATP-binding protein n=1 Tax=Spirosoma montaniterrae TaxID=1178516 RepID=A0A1P9WXU3_9BACT|nr:ABC transporter ATP-binding protein [Spirosoma montaniterrae]AQG80195.1 ABC transporter ATP-binding protein [Spirosoma montaniterrae]
MLQAINLTKRYDRKTALRELNLHVQAGEIYALLGANGAGKSTTINLFMGFLEPTSGQVFIDGIELREGGAATKPLVAYIPENVMLYPYLTGLQNLAFFSGLSGRNYTDTQLRDLLNRAGLQTDAHAQNVGTYSKGMRQKVGIAMALAKQAKALFLDEPTSGLDPLASNEFSNLIRSIRDDGVAILMVTHDLFRAKEAADRIGIMRDGVLVCELDAADVTPAELEAIYMKAVSNEPVTP